MWDQRDSQFSVPDCAEGTPRGKEGVCRDNRHLLSRTPDKCSQSESVTSIIKSSFNGGECAWRRVQGSATKWGALPVTTAHTDSPVFFYFFVIHEDSQSPLASAISSSSMHRSRKTFLNPCRRQKWTALDSEQHQEFTWLQMDEKRGK